MMSFGVYIDVTLHIHPFESLAKERKIIPLWCTEKITQESRLKASIMEYY
jgi:hypothetical protein